MAKGGHRLAPEMDKGTYNLNEQIASITNTFALIARLLTYGYTPRVIEDLYIQQERPT